MVALRYIPEITLQKLRASSNYFTASAMVIVEEEKISKISFTLLYAIYILTKVKRLTTHAHL